MKKITDITQLKESDRIVHLEGGEARFYTFLCVHPNNDKYVLLIDSLTQDAPKVYIDNILNGKWYTDYTLDDVRRNKIEFYERIIERIKKRLNNSEL